MFKRTEESKLTSWYFEIDRRLLGCVLLLIFISMIFAISAGSVAAERIGQPWHFFFVKSIKFYIIGLIMLFACSMLSARQIFILAVANVAAGLMLLPLTVIAPHVIKGSKRFVALGPLGNIMPADIMKPGFIIVTAWFLAKMHEKFGDNIFMNKDAWRLKWLSWWPYLALFVPTILIIFKHPDVGTFALYFATFSAMLFMAGLPIMAIPVLIGIVGLFGAAAFFTMPHVHSRIIAWATGTGDTYQVRQSIQSIQHGGLLGSGDDAFVKQSLPDAHTDFIFAAIAEDLGAIMACIVILGPLFFVIKRLTTDALNARDPFVFYAAGGAAALFGTQVCINMMSTLRIFAVKGMTLPFVSYGGSSFVAFCLLFGMILALVREDKWK